MGRIEQAAVQAVQLIGVLQHQGAGADIALLRHQLQPLQQHLPQGRRLALHLQADRRQPLPLAQQLCHLGPQIQVLLVHGLVIAQVRVPGDRHHRLLFDLIDLEDLPQMMGQDVLRPHKGAGAVRQHHDGRYHIRHPHDAQPPLVPFPQQRRSVQGLVLQVGERMAGVDDLGHQQRPHGLPVPGAHILPVAVFQLLIGDVHHAVLRQGTHQILIHLVPLPDQRHHRRIDPPQLLRRGKAPLVLLGAGGHQSQVRQAPHPHHEELVQIAGEDGEEAEPLHQRDGGVCGLLHHPLVKGQPAQLPVLGIAQVPAFSSL